MTDVIDLEEYKKKITESAANIDFELTREDREEVRSISSAIAEKYIAKLNETDHSFSLEASPSQVRLVQEKINALRGGLTGIIIELIQELAEKSIELHLLKKDR